MNPVHASEASIRRTGDDLRHQLLAGLPVAERRLTLAGVSTALIEGGAGSPIVLLHGPGANATHWIDVIPDLAATHRVIAPDLPGQGSSEVGDGPLDADRVMSWMAELIARTCGSPPVLVGFALGGAIAARFASRHSDALRRLVLVDALGLTPFAPAPEFGQALEAFVTGPSQDTHDHLWRHCAADLDHLRERMGPRWDRFAAYNVDRARTPSVQATLGTLMGELGAPAIPPADLERIAVPTTLIWGRHDMATPLRVAELASARYGWPLHVIDDCGDDPPVEQPDAFLRWLHGAIG
jgi:pimeloyl-ACP methyl ester carboxylesterase